MIKYELYDSEKIKRAGRDEAYLGTYLSMEDLEKAAEELELEDENVWIRVIEE